MTVKARPHSSEFSDVRKRTKVAKTIRIEFVQKVEDLTTLLHIVDCPQSQTGLEKIKPEDIVK